LARAKKKTVDDETLTRQLRRLHKAFPHATTALVHRNAWELLVATILAAQCTDKLINEVTPILFARYPTPADLAVADVLEVQQLIGKVTFFRNKSKNIIATAQAIVSRHDGEVPNTMAALVELPGVARKTANVVLGNAFGIAAGFVVDTHVMRLTQRLGFVTADEPIGIEAEMVERVPKRKWTLVANQLILHGRTTCLARSPKCEACPLGPECPSAEVA
jgi:endonuclease-3